MTNISKAVHSIVLVEDDPTFAAYLIEKLTFIGYAVEWIADGLRALLYLRRNRADLVLIDLALPNLDGISLLEHLRGESVAVGVPVMVLTGRFSARDVERATALGVNDYLAKPFDEGTFLSRIALHLGGAKDDDWVVFFES